MSPLSSKERRVLRRLAATGKIDWGQGGAHANTVNALRRKGLIASDGEGRRSVTAAGHAELAVPDLFADLFDNKEKP